MMEKKLFVKVHKSYRNVVAICDSNILGKKFEEGKRQLDIRESFYRGEEVDIKKAIEIMKLQKREDATFNIVGNFSVKTALEVGIIEEGNVGEVAGIKFALVFL